jgi:hypothetical protein
MEFIYKMTFGDGSDTMYFLLEKDTRWAYDCKRMVEVSVCRVLKDSKEYKEAVDNSKSAEFWKGEKRFKPFRTALEQIEEEKNIEVKAERHLLDIMRCFS